MERAGASFITVHGRTREQRGHPVNLGAIRDIKQSVGVPVVANGDIRSLGDMEDTVSATGCDGVMAARGMLENPAMYAGELWSEIKMIDGIDTTLIEFQQADRLLLYYYGNICEQKYMKPKKITLYFP